MANPKSKVAFTPALGTATAAVNAQFSGPNGMGVLYDVPPMFGPGLEVAPLTATNGVNTPKLGFGDGSIKTHG